MEYEIINEVQGSQAWLNARKNCDTASEASAALGKSKYQTRDSLLKQKSTGLTEEVSQATQALFNKGHQTEALARILAEKLIGEELYPITAKRIVDGLPLLASLDGLTMDGKIAFEHKLLSEGLIEQVESGNLEEHYTIQMDQQIVVTGAEKVLFVTSDGTENNFYYCWYKTSKVKEDELIAGWHQFKSDLKRYVPKASIEQPKAESTIALPSLFINAKAEITASNMAEYGVALNKRLDEVRSIILVNDQDFANAKQGAKQLREGIEQAKNALDAMTAQNTSFNEAKRMIESWIENMRLTALKLEKDVEREDKLKKAKMISVAQGEYQEHLDDLSVGTAPIRISNANPDFAAAIKGKSKYDSMQSAIDTLLAQAKASANTIDMDIQAKQTWMKNHTGYENLFPDMQTIIFKPIDDFKLLVEYRINNQKQKEIAQQAEIKAKAEAEARAKVEAEQLAKEKLAEKEAAAVYQAQYEADLMKPVEIKSSLPVNLEQTFKKMFAVEDNTPAQPGPNDLVKAIAGAYKVGEELAYEWLVSAFSNVKEAA